MSSFQQPRLNVQHKAVYVRKSRETTVDSVAEELQSTLDEYAEWNLVNVVFMGDRDWVLFFSRKAAIQ